MTSADISLVLPEIVLAVYAMAALMFGVYTTKDKAAPLITWVTSGVFVLVGLMVGFGGDGTNVAFGGIVHRRRVSRALPR